MGPICLPYPVLFDAASMPVDIEFEKQIKYKYVCSLGENTILKNSSIEGKKQNIQHSPKFCIISTGVSNIIKIRRTNILDHLEQFGNNTRMSLDSQDIVVEVC